jgi:hypothetical protein
MIGRNKDSLRLYDPRECFYSWLRLGTIRLAIEDMYLRGFRDKDNGKPKYASIQYNANKFIISNPEEARKILIENGLMLKEDYAWHNFLIRRAKLALRNQNSFIVWLRANNLLEVAKIAHIIPADYEA